MSPRAKPIFIEALDLPADRREAFLLNACREDEALLAEVRGLLATYEDAGDFLDAPAANAPLTLADFPTRTPAPSFQPGQTIGRYTLIRALGEGGFGVVWLASQSEPVERQVAIKILKVGFDSQQIVARFRAEQQALAVMDHPGIARIFDAGTTADRRPFFAMEFVDGLPITDYADRNRLDIRGRLELLEAAALAVQHAHTKGVIHRDIKPGNILVTNVDGRPLPKVIDFGIAKAVEASPEDVKLTQEFQLVGTPQYMSPEQAAAGTARLDTRSDVYSLGTVLYELIAGAPPFDQDDLRRAGFDGMLKMVREQTPVKPSSRITSLGESVRTVAQQRRSEPGTLRRKLSGEVDWIVMRALEKDPARRYQSAAELAEDIRRHLRNEPIHAGPPSALYAARKFVRRNRLPVAAAAVVSLVLIAATAVSVTAANRARVAETQAKQDYAFASRELVRSQATSKFLESVLTGIDPNIASTEDTTLMRKILEDAEQRIAGDVADQPSVEVEVRSMIGRTYHAIEQREKAREQLEKAWSVGRERLGMDDPITLTAGTTLGALYFDLGKYDESAKVLGDVVAGFDRIGLADDARGMAARNNLATVMFIRGSVAESEKIYTELIRIRRRVDPDSMSLFINENNLTAVKRKLGKLDEAIVDLQDLLDREVKVLGELNPTTLATMGNLASALDEVGRPEEAAAMYRRTLEGRKKILPRGHSTIIRAQHNLAAFLVGQKKFDEANELLAEAIPAALETLGPDDDVTLTTYLRLAELKRIEGNLEESNDAAARAYDGLLKLHGPTNSNVLAAAAVLSNNLFELGRWEEAVRRIDPIPDTLPPTVNAATARSFYVAAARVRMEAGQNDRVRALIDRAKVYGPLADPDVLEPRIAEIERRLNEE